MAIRKIIYLPNPILRQVAKPVDNFDSELHTLIDDMFETMYSVQGVGLAAPQVGESIRLSVIDVTASEKKEPLVLVNPELIESHGEKAFQEGCLSVPGAYDTVMRAETIRFKALDRQGLPYEMEVDGLLAECVQHEIDHLNGKLFVDMLSPLKRNRARKKMEKYLKMSRNHS